MCASTVDDVVQVLALRELRVLLVCSSVLIVDDDAVCCDLAGEEGGSRPFLAEQSSGRCSLPLFVAARGDLSRERSNLYIVARDADGYYYTSVNGYCLTPLFSGVASIDLNRRDNAGTVRA